MPKFFAICRSGASPLRATADVSSELGGKLFRHEADASRKDESWHVRSDGGAPARADRGLEEVDVLGAAGLPAHDRPGIPVDEECHADEYPGHQL